eukprot:1143255-Pelagomonas_calceolata.AAC.4
MKSTKREEYMSGGATLMACLSCMTDFMPRSKSLRVLYSCATQKHTASQLAAQIARTQSHELAAQSHELIAYNNTASQLAAQIARTESHKLVAQTHELIAYTSKTS